MRQGDNSAIPAARGPPKRQIQAIRQHQQRKEGDLIIGKGGRTAVATLVERVTRITIHVKVSTRRSTDVVAAIARRMRAGHVLTITWDQGSEMASHLSFTIATGIPVYFCDPHSPWQRGSNENTNGLIRQYLPKSTDLSVHTADDLLAIQRSLNGRPRKTLGYKMPEEKLAEIVALST